MDAHKCNENISANSLLNNHILLVVKYTTLNFSYSQNLCIMKTKLFSSSNESIKTAIFLIRVGFGIIFILHGFPKIAGGVDTWTWLGENMGLVGLGFAPAFWGFMAAIAEFAGGILLILGLLTRPAALLMAFTMLIAAIMHITGGDDLNTVLHPLKGFVVFIALLYGGPGKYAIDNTWSK